MSKPEYPNLAMIDGQPINIPTLDTGVAAAIEYAKAGRGFRFFTLNLDHIVKLRSDPDFVCADGAPVALLARRQAPGIDRTTGADLVRPLCASAARAGIPVAFFGSNMETLTTAATRLTGEFRDLQIAHCEAPPYGFDPTSAMAEEAVSRIAASGARIVFVALGAPKQEFFSAHMAKHAPDLGFICIGAALDFIAGTQTRAPMLFQKSGLEWLWRLGTNPSRLAKRYALCVGLLVSLVIRGPRAISTRAGSKRLEA